MKVRQRTLILTLLVGYTTLIVYFLFFGVGRPELATTNHEYQFTLIPTLISFNFPSIADFKYFPHGFFELGNFGGFIPFGVLIALLYRTSMLRFVLLFFLGILIIELIQMLTLLGSFDINDAIINTLGAAVGFGAYSIATRYTSTGKRLVVTLGAVIILSVGVIGFVELLHKSFTKHEGAVIALHQLESNPDKPRDQNLKSFVIGSETITPKLNSYTSEGQAMKTFSYLFDKQDIALSLHYGIPNHISDKSGEITIAVNGNPVEHYSPTSYGKSEILLNKINELTITIRGSVYLWDVTVQEMKYWRQ